MTWRLSATAAANSASAAAATATAAAAASATAHKELLSAVRGVVRDESKRVLEVCIKTHTLYTLYYTPTYHTYLYTFIHLFTY
jgi:hypothetical protein